MKKPKFSVICPAFNHEKYVGWFIDSVLAQTVEDWELVIVDDCSYDNTVNIIKSYNDKRIKFIQHKTNGGINAAINTGFENASGEFWVLVASDDVMCEDALEKIGKAFDNNPNAVAVYCNLSVIDENNNLREDIVMGQLVNRSRASFLHDAFMSGNVLYGPGMSMRAKYGKKLYPANPANCIFQDYIQNVQLLMMGDVFVLPEKIIKYRITHDQKNISAAGFYTNMRENLETDSLLDTFLEIKDVNLLKDMFKKEIADNNINIKKIGDIKYFLGRMALLSDNVYRKIWGFHQVMDCYNSDKDKMFRDYNFQFRDLVGLVKNFKEPDDNKIVLQYEAKHKKYKKLFNIMLGVSTILLIVLFGVLL